MPDRRAYIRDYLAQEAAAPVRVIAAEIAKKHQGSAVLLYGSGNSLLKVAKVDNVLFDFYVISPDYDSAFASPAMRAAGRLIPPNVFYIECDSAFGRLRAKYAVLSIAHFETLVSRRTFHSYFWARFAQPSRIVLGPEDLRRRIEHCVETAVDTFVARSIGLVDARDVGAIWRAGLERSYKAELRAEQPDRVARLLESYGEWPARVTILPAERPSARPGLDWRLRSVQGGFLSVARLLKASFTFEGGVDYMAWKISRHAGFTLPVRDWERRWPLLSAPILAGRYYRLKRKARGG